jgi:hypothetical protein
MTRPGGKKGSLFKFPATIVSGLKLGADPLPLGVWVGAEVRKMSPAVSIQIYR